MWLHLVYGADFICIWTLLLQKDLISDEALESLKKEALTFYIQKTHTYVIF
jgi:hypothetical protein